MILEEPSIQSHTHIMYGLWDSSKGISSHLRYYLHRLSLHFHFTHFMFNHDRAGT